MYKSLSVIIVNYNTAEILKDCINNLLSFNEPLEIIVVDNNSPDNSVAVIQENFPQVKLIANKENVGLAIASNQGFKISTGDYVLYLGSDAFPKKGDLQEMIGYMEAVPEIGGATAKLVLRSGKLDMDAHRGFPTPWASFTHFSNINKLFPRSKLLNQYFLGNLDLNTPHEIDLCISHFLLLKRKVIEDLNGWDEHFYIFGEDVDFCYRLKQAGWKLMYLPQWEVLHYKGASAGIRKDTQDITKATLEIKKAMRKRSVEAMELFYKTHYYKKYPKLISYIVLAGINLMGKRRDKLN